MRQWVCVVGAMLLAGGCRGRHEGPGQIARTRPPAQAVADRVRVQDAARAALDPVPGGEAKQILFGDLHVHTTFSPDAFLRSLPLLQGEGARPPADACDFARFCAALDFWSINDHAEGISPRHWRETKESIRQCTALSGDPENPDLVSFLGWEWTQVGVTPETHFGHKNVVLRETAEDQVPKRPISALDRQLIGGLRQRPPLWQRIQFPLLDFANRQRYLDFGRYQDELAGVPICAEGVDTRELPEDCSEVAHTPQELFEKLAQWGGDALVIPHGNTWGFYTPPGSSWDGQLTGAQHDPQRQTLIEVYSGHGNSEEFRRWREIARDERGAVVCPPPTPDYLPCCWQAGEIVRGRCGDAPSAECERRVATARLDYLQAGVGGRMTLPGTAAEEWKDCGQCRDCFNPSFTYRPGGSSQYALALTNFDGPGAPRRFRFGFVASSDNHSARPGTGYKEFARRLMTEAAGARSAGWRSRVMGSDEVPARESRHWDQSMLPEGPQALRFLDLERQASFFMTGGLVAAHATGRDRDAIWAALVRREVYGTSGERILLWFDLLNGPRGRLPMGSETTLAEPPHFRVRAVGSFRHRPGCPQWSVTALGPARLQTLCRGECYHPGDERLAITRIEVVRIRPQAHPGEPVASLIEDPWRRFPCPGGASGCAVEFDDPEFVAGGRETIYYVRAVQEPTPAVNAGGLRCEFDERGTCVRVRPCFGDYRTPYEDDCLAPNEERAWSSPIYVRH